MAERRRLEQVLLQVSITAEAERLAREDQAAEAERPARAVARRAEPKTRQQGAH